MNNLLRKIELFIIILLAVIIAFVFVCRLDIKCSGKVLGCSGYLCPVYADTMVVFGEVALLVVLTLHYFFLSKKSK